MYKEKEGLILDPSKMEFNPGKRSVAKLMSNSLWGKLAQRSDLSEIVITKTAAEFHKVMADNTHEVMDFVHINGQTDRLVIKKKPEFQKPGKTTCLPVACFVTSHARLKLYSYLVKASAKRRLYSDTDSMGYILRRGSVPITEGIFLGEMSREYSDCVIIEIVIAGPKNYALLLLMPNGQLRVVMKIRGFPLDYANSQIISYELFKEKVLQKFRDGGFPDPVRLNYQTIKRNKYGYLHSVPMEKKWIPFLKKGFVDPKTMKVYEWGYTD